MSWFIVSPSVVLIGIVRGTGFRYCSPLFEEVSPTVVQSMFLNGVFSMNVSLQNKYHMESERLSRTD